MLTRAGWGCASPPQVHPCSGPGSRAPRLSARLCRGPAGCGEAARRLRAGGGGGSPGLEQLGQGTLQKALVSCGLSRMLEALELVLLGPVLACGVLFLLKE